MRTSFCSLIWYLCDRLVDNFAQIYAHNMNNHDNKYRLYSHVSLCEDLWCFDTIGKTNDLRDENGAYSILMWIVIKINIKHKLNDFKTISQTDHSLLFYAAPWTDILINATREQSPSSDISKKDEKRQWHWAL